LNAAINTMAKTRMGHCARTAGQKATFVFCPVVPLDASQIGDSSTLKKMNTARRIGTTPMMKSPRQPMTGISRPKVIDASR
jgi:hypothetical protein